MSGQLLQAGFDLPLTLAVLFGLVSMYAFYLTLRPLVEEGQISAEEWERIEDESIALINRRDRLIDELKDLEFEAEMNKLGARDLSALRSRYEAEALAVIAQLDDRASAYQAQIDDAVQDTLAEARARKQARAEKASTEEPTAEEPTAEEPTAEEPTAEEPTAEEPTAEEPTAEEPTAEEPTAEEPTVDDVAQDDIALEDS
jgi:hypothetical protein